MSVRTVILTVPHRCYPNVHDPGCDDTAYDHALDLQQRLIARGYNTILLTNKVPRAQTDQNRREGRRLPMREELRTFLREYSKRSTAVLLDIHSFPQSDRPDWSPILVLAGADGAGPRSFYAILRKYLPGTKMGASPVNDIVTESADFGIPAALIETTDSLESGYLEKLTDAVVEWHPPPDSVIQPYPQFHRFHLH